MARQKLTHAYYAFASYVRREGHLYEVFLVLAKTRLIKEQVLRAVLIRRVLAKSRLILDEMCRLYGKFVFPRINGPNVYVWDSLPYPTEFLTLTSRVCTGVR